ncbi:Arb2 domain-containing protein [Penicillium brasilianum]|uniref:Arb2 domain-containing protein n=1 Tax=Penicillium brasilianum TaxID=104259 RepID=A0A1S9RCH7_PENBI|nr:Arb2 domain-containing protein [Penicillium brasilianum]
MYVYRSSDLPPDPHFPADLEKLGYTITADDKIRSSIDLETGFKYKINRNDRYNVKNREAMDECIRRIVISRLQEAGLEIWRLPFGNGPQESKAPTSEPHVPIQVSKNLSKAARVIVVFGDLVQDLGIWTYRSVGADGINFGSAVNFTKSVLGDATDNTGTALVIANTGQLLWHCASSRAVTQRTWEAADRPVGPLGQATRSWRNKIPGNKDWREHIQFVFEHVLWPWLNEKSRIDVIGLSEGGQGAIEYLQKRWAVWKPYISGICLGNPLHSTVVDLDMSTLTDPKPFTTFLASRGRAYVISSDEVGKFQARYRDHGCNCYASGEEFNAECIMPHAWRDMLAWLNVLYLNPDYAEQVMVRSEDVDEKTREAVENMTVEDEESVTAEVGTKDD